MSAGEKALPRTSAT
ncbi:LPKTxAVK-anchored surface protein [Nioella sp.]